jgi:hypothetical protein
MRGLHERGTLWLSARIWPCRAGFWRPESKNQDKLDVE